MNKYDVIVVGAGSGLLVAEAAAGSGLKVAVIEKSHLGGTCLNTGCIPSKLLIYPADVISQIRNASKLGIEAAVSGIDFAAMMERTAFTVKGYRNKLARRLKRIQNIDLYQHEARFQSNYVIRAGQELLSAPRIFIACGARPVKPFDEKGVITSDNLLEVTVLPRELTILGGGYIACEYAHLFSSLGSKVILIEMLDRLLYFEEPEISEIVEKTLAERISIRKNLMLTGVNKTSRGWEVYAQNTLSGRKEVLQAEHLLSAMGRISNADLLGLENTDLRIDSSGYIKVDRFLRTGVDGIFAIGDVIGKQMFRHAADYEARVAWHNSGQKDEKQWLRVNYRSIPHAVFTSPPVASVGLTEKEAVKKFPVLVGKANYLETAKGHAMQAREGFTKAVVHKNTGKILGFHMAGPSSDMLIQEVTDALASGGSPDFIGRGIHIHPSLSEIIPLTFSNLGEP